MQRGFLILLICLFSTNHQGLWSQIFFEDQAPNQNILISYGEGTAGGGVSFCDFNQDGWDDLTVSSHNGAPIRFYQNNNGVFTAIVPLVNESGESKQVIWVDFDNDGDLDFYVSNKGSINRLYENTGDLNLVDITNSAGLNVPTFDSWGAIWGDYDRDGWLDLYVGKRELGVEAENQSFLFKNNGDKTFTEIGQFANANDPDKLPFCSAFFDYNNDGWPDIYTAQDKTTVNTLLSNNKDGTFTDISESSNTNIAANAMNVSCADYNNDGWQDIYFSNSPGLGNKLLQNNGDGTFTEVADEVGVGFYGIGWGANFFDADNDGYLDLYASGAGVGLGEDATPSAFYQNDGTGIFIETDFGFVGDTVSSYSNAIGDFNQDGLMDIFVVNTAPFDCHLWQNQSNTSNAFIKINLEGVLSNKSGVGSLIEVYFNGEKRIRYTQCGTGFMGQNSFTETIGLGAAEIVDSIKVSWPTGHTDLLTNIPSNQTIDIIEGSTTNGEINVADEVLNFTLNGLPNINQGSISVYPNPSKNQVFVESNTTIKLVEILDYKGQLLQSKTASTDNKTMELDLNNWTGILFLKITNEQGTFIKKQLNLE